MCIFFLAWLFGPVAVADTPLISVDPTVSVTRQGDRAVLLQVKPGSQGTMADLTRSALVIAEVLQVDRIRADSGGIALESDQTISLGDVERCTALLQNRFATMKFDDVLDGMEKVLPSQVVNHNVDVDVGERHPRMARLVFPRVGMEPMLRKAFLVRWLVSHPGAEFQIIPICTNDKVLMEVLILSNQQFCVETEKGLETDLRDWYQRVQYMLQFGA